MPPIPTAAIVLIGDEEGDPLPQVSGDLVESMGRVPISEEPSPAAHDNIDVVHNLLDRKRQPGPVREFTHPVAYMLLRLA